MTIGPRRSNAATEKARMRITPNSFSFESFAPALRAGALALLVCSAGAFANPARASLPSTNVAWLPAAADADVDRAFAQARAQNKPVLLYWGASWCPPCNQLKATLFNRQDFAAQSKAFVAVHVDGDRPSAQKLGSRFKVSGYPTLVLFAPEGREITRLPGEAEEIPPECGVMVARGEAFASLEIVRPAPARAMRFEAGLPFAVWMALARAVPMPAPADDEVQRRLGESPGPTPDQ